MIDLFTVAREVLIKAKDLSSPKEAALKAQVIEGVRRTETLIT